MTMPKALQAVLIADSVMTERGVTRKGRARRCPRCGAPTLAGICDMGFETYLQPAPVTVEGELLALLSGARTYRILGTDIVLRGRERINAQSADDEEVFGAHRCGQSWPTNPKWVKELKRINPFEKPPF